MSAAGHVRAADEDGFSAETQNAPSAATGETVRAERVSGAGAFSHLQSQRSLSEDSGFGFGSPLPIYPPASIWLPH